MHPAWWWRAEQIYLSPFRFTHDVWQGSFCNKVFQHPPVLHCVTKIMVFDGGCLGLYWCEVRGLQAGLAHCFEPQELKNGDQVVAHMSYLGSDIGPNYALIGRYSPPASSRHDSGLDHASLFDNFSKKALEPVPGTGATFITKLG